jgi:hypothetical protein
MVRQQPRTALRALGGSPHHGDQQTVRLQLRRTRAIMPRLATPMKARVMVLTRLSVRRPSTRHHGPDLGRGTILAVETVDAMTASRRSQESLFFPWGLLLGAVALAACSSSKLDDGLPDAGVTDAESSDLPLLEAHPAEDASAGEVDQPCALRGDATCTASAGCFAIRGIPFVDLCQGRGSPTFAGCVPGGPDGGTMIRWGRQETTGQIFQFPTTQMPVGWATIAEPACPPDGG